MFCTKCGKEILNGKKCSECSPDKKGEVAGDNKVEASQRIKIMIFSVIALLTLCNLFVNILEYKIIYKDMAFSFFSFVTTITEFKCLNGTNGAIMLSMLVLLITSIKLASKAGYALVSCGRRDKMKKVYDGLISGCAFWGISCLVISVLLYFSHTSALKKMGMDSVAGSVEIPTVFIVVYIVAIALAIVVDVDYEINGKKIK